MAKTLRYPNGMILKGTHSRVSLLRGVKRTTAGVVSMVNAPTKTASLTGLTLTGTKTTTLTAGLTGNTGACGRNWLSGKFACIGTAAVKKSIFAYLKTIGGSTITLGSATAVATKVTKTVAINTKGLPWAAPGVLTLKGTAGTKQINILKFSVLKVNDMTSQMM